MLFGGRTPTQLQPMRHAVRITAFTPPTFGCGSGLNGSVFLERMTVPCIVISDNSFRACAENSDTAPAYGRRHLA